MEASASLRKKIIEKYGPTIDLDKDPKIVDDIFEEVKAICQADLAGNKKTAPPDPFGVSWMDSWVAHWVASQGGSAELSPGGEFEPVLKGLVELKFKDRLSELRKFIDLRSTTPDGGTPEPGVRSPPEPPGPSPIFAVPDGGPPEPGVPSPPEPPEPPGPSLMFSTPDGGTPEPGTPPAGPAGIDPDLMRENPWILYWFVSIKAPLILDMIDAHFTRRINELAEQTTNQGS